MKPDKSDRRFKCTACRQPSIGAGFMCCACHESGNYRCSSVAASLLIGRATASAMAAKAIKSGNLPRATSCKCVDCGKPASLYEHRDYNKPLDVVPTCRPCNSRRGMAIPLRGGIKKVVEFGFIPYAAKSRVIQLLTTLGLDTLPLQRIPRKKLTHADWVGLLPVFAEIDAISKAME